ncbi:unnamed protein product [Choristocarpus tenellus]
MQGRGSLLVVGLILIRGFATSDIAPSTDRSHAMSELPRVNLTNRGYLESLQKINSLFWDSDEEEIIAVRISIRKTAASSSTNPEEVMMTFEAVERAAYEAYDSIQEEIEWSADHYESEDPAEALWCLFFHMIDARGQGRIFGSRYHGGGLQEGGLLELVEKLHSDYIEGQTVEILLSQLAIADEMGGDGDTGLMQALNMINKAGAGAEGEWEIIQSFQCPPYPFPPSYRLGGWPIKDLMVDGVMISVLRQGCPQSIKVLGAPVDLTAKFLVAGRLQVEYLKLEMREFEYMVVGGFLDKWIYNIGGDRMRAGDAGDYYGWLARVAGEAFARWCEEFMRGMGVEEDGMVKWIWNHLGSEAGGRFAAFGVSGVQRGVRGLGYSGYEEAGGEETGTVSVKEIFNLRRGQSETFKVALARRLGNSEAEEVSDENVLEDVVDVSVSVALLRKVGRMGYTNNVLQGVPTVGGQQFVVQRGGKWICVAADETGAELLWGRLDDDIVVG